MSTERTPRTDKELWRSLAPDRDVVPRPVSDIDFAAWLDGRLPEAAAARIEAAVAADPALRRAALDLADVLGKPLPAAPARLATRAQALAALHGMAVQQSAQRLALAAVETEVVDQRVDRARAGAGWWWRESRLTRLEGRRRDPAPIDEAREHEAVEQQRQAEQELDRTRRHVRSRPRNRSIHPTMPA